MFYTDINQILDLRIVIKKVSNDLNAFMLSSFSAVSPPFFVPHWVEQLHLCCSHYIFTFQYEYYECLVDSTLFFSCF